jgi:hypothetical protein
MAEPRVRGDFAEKLRLTAAALRCASHKDLCARFRTVNPTTQCDIERLHKWIQGRAQPRSPQVYDDWAKVLGTQRSGAWLISSSLDEFSAELSALSGTPIADLHRLDAVRTRAAPRAGKLALLGGAMALCGNFACYSHAWSPHFRGKLLRGGLRIEPGKAGGLGAIYSENLVDRTVRLTGEVILSGRSLHLHVRESDSELPLFFSMFLPGPPVSLLSGVMSGIALVAHEPLPSYSRVLMVRVSPETDLDGSNRYMEWSAAAVSEDLTRLGVVFDETVRLDALVAEFLGENVDQTSMSDQAELSALFDKVRLGQRQSRA